MTPPSTVDSCQENGHLVHVRAITDGDKWNYIVDVKAPSGHWLPEVTDHDRTYDSAEEALAEGLTVGKHVANS